MSQRCEYYQELISACLDRELSEAEASALRSHLRTCAECRALMASFASLSELMDMDAAEPPAALAEGVMERIRAWEQSRTEQPERTESVPGPVPISRARGARKTSRLRTSLVAAACAVLVLGGAWYGLNHAGGGSASRLQEESVTLEAPMTESAPFEEAEEQEEAPPAGGVFAAAAEDGMPATGNGRPEPAERPQEVEEDAAFEAGTAERRFQESGVTAAGSAPQYTWQSPALVPAGREAEFSALIAAAPWPDGVSAEELQVIAAVEYRGIIYEFLTPEDGDILFWKDAAESVDPIPASGTPDTLWSIIE